MHKLYVFLRSDLASLNPGKAAAQVAHAASQIAWKMNRCDVYDVLESYRAWESSADGFGTTIVLDGKGLMTSHETMSGDIGSILCRLVGNDRWGYVQDPSYPVRDGQVTHLIPLVTCYWLFVDPDEDPRVRAFLDGFSLYR